MSSDGGADGPAESGGRRSDRFDRLPPSPAAAGDPDRPTRAGVVDFFAERFGVPRATWTGYTFWEKGADKVWAYAGDLEGPVTVETLGTMLVRTGGRHRKPTTDGVQRFGRAATRNVVALDGPAARRFLAGEEQQLAWDGDWGYLIAAHELAGGFEPIGVGLYTHGTLESMVPKGRRREL